MTIKAISEMKKTHEEMGEVLEYLSEHEDGLDADWSEVVIDYKWLLQQCKHRKTTLEKRGRTL